MSYVLGATEEVTVKKRKITGISCDICKRVMPAANKNCGVNTYYRVMTGHHEWFNDSCDSIENMDICPECIRDFTAKYLNDTEYDSAYININRRHIYPGYDQK